MRVRNAVASSGGAHASRVLASASRDRELSFEGIDAPSGAAEKQDCFGGTPNQHARRVCSPDYANRREAIRRAVGGIVRARIRG